MAGRICRFVATVNLESYSVTMLSCGSATGSLAGVKGMRGGACLSSLDTIRPPRDYADSEAGSFAKMQVPSKGPPRAAGAHDQTDRGARENAYNWVIQMKIQRDALLCQMNSTVALIIASVSSSQTKPDASKSLWPFLTSKSSAALATSSSPSSSTQHCSDRKVS
jgi:hypothetical protein